MNFDDIIRKRKSFREFKKKSPSWKNMLEAIDTTTKGPFAGNYNNLKFIIVEDKNNIERIAEHTGQPWVKKVPALIVICSDDTHLEKIYGERGRIYSRQQAGASIQTLIFKLVDLGLDTCWIGAFTDELIKEILNIPQHIQIEAIIATGYGDPKAKTQRKNKKELENVLFWENWDNKKRPTIFREPFDKHSLM